MRSRTGKKKKAGSGDKKPARKASAGRTSSKRTARKTSASKRPTRKSGDRKSSTKKKTASRKPTPARRKKTNRGGRVSGWLTLSLGLAALIAVLGAAAWLFMPSAPEKAPRPAAKRPAAAKPIRPAKTPKKPSPVKRFAYEVGPTRFQRRLALVDAAIMRGLAEAGVKDRNIGFLKVKNVVADAVSYERAEMGIDLNGVAPEKVEEAVLAALGDLDFGVSLTGGEGPGGQVLKVWLAKRLTHTIRLNGRAARAASKGRAAIIIDDIGYHPRGDAAFLKLDLPLTLSVLPFSPVGRKVAGEAAAKGFEVMLHLPMEPKGYPRSDPGPGALLTGMGTKELVEALIAGLNEVPQAKGVNNHMGSALTEDGKAMAVVMAELKRRGLFFIDSRTSARSRAQAEARRLGVPTARRAVFLDNVPQVEAIKAQLRRLIARAEAEGQAIAIAHPHPATLTALSQMSGELKRRLDLVPASRLTN